MVEKLLSAFLIFLFLISVFILNNRLHRLYTSFASAFSSPISFWTRHWRSQTSVNKKSCKELNAISTLPNKCDSRKNLCKRYLVAWSKLWGKTRFWIFMLASHVFLPLYFVSFLHEGWICTLVYNAFISFTCSTVNCVQRKCCNSVGGLYIPRQDNLPAQTLPSTVR